MVAVLWQILFARCFQVPVDALAALLLLLTVWLIYAADRTLDACKGECHSPRHEFYRRRWRELLPVWVAILGLTGWLAAERLSSDLFLRGAILMAAVGIYFALVHSGILRWPKEAAVGVLFALGASLVAWGKSEDSGRRGHHSSFFRFVLDELHRHPEVGGRKVGLVAEHSGDCSGLRRGGPALRAPADSGRRGTGERFRFSAAGSRASGGCRRMLYGFWPTWLC